MIRARLVFRLRVAQKLPNPRQSAVSNIQNRAGWMGGRGGGDGFLFRAHTQCSSMNTNSILRLKSRFFFGGGNGYSIYDQQGWDRFFFFVKPVDQKNEKLNCKLITIVQRSTSTLSLFKAALRVVPVSFKRFPDNQIYFKIS